LSCRIVIAAALRPSSRAPADDAPVAIFCRFLSFFCQCNNAGQSIAITTKPIFCRICHAVPSGASRNFRKSM